MRCAGSGGWKTAILKCGGLWGNHKVGFAQSLDLESWAILLLRIPTAFQLQELIGWSCFRFGRVISATSWGPEHVLCWYTTILFRPKAHASQGTCSNTHDADTSQRRELRVSLCNFIVIISKQSSICGWADTQKTCSSGFRVVVCWQGHSLSKCSGVLMSSLDTATLRRLTDGKAFQRKWFHPSNAQRFSVTGCSKPK